MLRHQHEDGGFGLWPGTPAALHYTAYAAAAVFFAHGILSDPNLQNNPVDWIDAEKVYVEACALLIVAATALRVRWRLGPRGRLARAR